MGRGAMAIAVWVLAAAAALGVIDARPAHAAPTVVLRATPDVAVVHLPGPGSVALSNDTADPITIASLTRDPGCDDEVTAELTTPATVLPGNNVSVAVKCANTFTTGMKRCGFHALPAAGAPLVDFEGVCEAGNAITLAAAPTMFDFGDVAVGASASQTFTITNNSAMIIAQLALQTTDLGATFELGAPCNPDARECDAPIVGIGTSETTQLTVWCRPKATGVHTAQLHIASDTPAHLAMPVVLTCNGTAAAGSAFALTGDPVDAGSVEVTNSSATPRALRVRNAGMLPLSITSVQIVDSGDGAANDWSFTFDPGTSGCMSLSSSCTVAAGKEISLALRFDPNAIGARSAVLVISYSDGAARSRTIPLTGTGLGATLSFLGTPLAVELGTIPVGTQSAPQAFSLYNHGNRDATVDLAFAAPPGPGPFTLAPPTMLTLPPGPSDDVMITCTPTAPGEATAKIQVTSADAALAAPIDINAHCTGTNAALFTQPSVIQLGEVRVGAPFTFPVTMRSTGAPLQIVSIALENQNDNLEMDPTLPVTTVAMFSLLVHPTAEGPLENNIIVTTSTNITVRVPIRGSVVSDASDAYAVPPTRSLGTFCVNQPTTPDRFSLTTSTGTVLLSEPALDKGKQSPFDLTLLSPTSYPTPIAPTSAASVVITPKRSNVAGAITDDLVWTTDVAGHLSDRTTIRAEFVDDGGAVAPSSLAFAPTLVHLDTDNAQRVTLQNCDTQAIDLQITVPAPFRVDVGALPTSLAPNETATLSIGFHPTRVGQFDGTLLIVSGQLTDPLTVSLSGEGFTTPVPSDGGVMPPDIDDTSFYSCDGCASNKPNACALALGVLVLIARRRRR